MIRISLTEAFVYDILAITEVKTKKGVCTFRDYHQQSKEISEEVGKKLHEDILRSDEYRKLYEANELTFEAVDKAKVDEVKASVVHNLNNERFLAKKALQQKFFPTAEFTEKKN